MPAAAAAVSAWWAGLTWYEIAYGVIVAAAGAYSIVSSLSQSKATDTAVSDSGQQVNSSIISDPLPLVYGLTRVGINRVYVGVSGKDNKYLHVVGNICEGEVDGIVQLYLNDEVYTSFGTENVHYSFATGSTTQGVNSLLHASIPEWNECKKRTCYIYLRYKYNIDVFQSIPDVTVLLRGLKVYNPATGLIEYSNNPALCALDFLTRSSRRGGMGFDISRIDLDSVIDAAAYCDDKGWTCNLCLNENNSASDNFQHILATFRGALVYNGSTFKLKYRDLNYESVVMNFTEDDVIDNGTSTLKIVQPSIFDTPNAVNCSYPDTENNYQYNNYILADNDACEDDGGDYREKAVSLYGITNVANVQKMANYFLEKFRLNKTCSFTSGMQAIPIESMDLVTLTHSRPGWDAKVFRVTTPIIAYDGTVVLNLEEEFASMYDDTYNLSQHIWRDTLLPDPKTAVPSVINVSHSEETYFYRDRTYTRWKIAFDPPSEDDYPWWDYADIYVKIGDGDWNFVTKSDGDYQLDPVQEGVTYYCRIVSVSIWGSKQSFDDGYEVSKAIVGKTSIPSDIAKITALAHGDNVSIYGDALTDSDISIYELRLGSAWTGGLYIGSNETPNFRLVGVRPATHTFWMSAKDNAGNYSDTPASSQVTVYYPAGYVDKHSWTWDFDGIGTFTNMEHCIYEGVDSLKCSHTDGVLTGTWLSPEYDMGSVKTVRVWGDFITVMVESGGLWSALFPAGTLWSDKMTSTTKWYEILAPAYAGIIQAKLYWGTVSGDLSSSAEKLEILAPEISARYLQVEITITDPDVGSNLYLNLLNMKAAYWV